MFKNVKNLQMFTNGAKLVQQSLIEVFKEMHLPYMKETIWQPGNSLNYFGLTWWQKNLVEHTNIYSVQVSGKSIIKNV